MAGSRQLIRKLLWLPALMVGLAAVIWLNSSGEEPALLSRVPELQERARLVISGERSADPGEVAVLTSRGVNTIVSGPAPAYVFGRRARASELVDLLKARARSNRTGRGPMAGEKRELLSITVLMLGTVGEPEAVSPIAALLDDPDENVREMAALALFKMGDTEAQLRSSVAEIVFPRAVIEALQKKGVTVPDWVTQARDGAR